MNTAIITGTTRGLGKAMDEQFKAAGWATHQLNRPEFDLSSFDIGHTWKRLSDIKAHGRVVLVNNAATHHIEPVRDLSQETIKHEISTNLTGPISLISGFLRIFPDGEVANITSAAATVPHEHWSLYGVAKAAMNAFMAHLEVEGVKTFNLNPGAVATDMQAAIATSSSPLPAGGKVRDVSIVAKALVWQVDRG